MRSKAFEKGSLNYMMMDKLYGTNIDFDSLWTKFDFDSNGFLDLKEAMYFLDEV